MFVYICLDSSMRMVLNEDGKHTTEKTSKALALISELVEKFDKNEVNINLIALKEKSEIVCELARTSTDVINAFET